MSLPLRMAALTLLLWSTPTLAGELVLAGSTTFQKRIAEPVAAALEKATGIKLVIRGTNSGKGLQELMAGKIPASVSSSPMKTLFEHTGSAFDSSYQEHVIIEDNIVPIVHPENSVSSLTHEQLAKLNTGEFTNWKEVGGPDQAVVVVTSQPDAATRIVYEELVLKKKPFVAGFREVRSTREEVDLVGKFKGGLGAVSKAFVDLNPGKVKVVQTAPISRPLSIITKGKPSAEIQQLIEFLRSAEGRKLMR